MTRAERHLLREQVSYPKPLGSGKQKSTRGCVPASYITGIAVKFMTDFGNFPLNKIFLNRSHRGSAQGLNGLSPESPQACPHLCTPSLAAAVGALVHRLLGGSMEREIGHGSGSGSGVFRAFSWERASWERAGRARAWACWARGGSRGRRLVGGASGAWLPGLGFRLWAIACQVGSRARDR